MGSGVKIIAFTGIAMAELSMGRSFHRKAGWKESCGAIFWRFDLDKFFW